jgi:hemerythrin
MLWDKSFEIGCELVDNQHRELVALVSGFEGAVHGKVTGQQLAEVLKFIVNYTRHHFSSEEAFMEKISYPELANHKKIHDELINKVTKILLDLKSGKKPEPEFLLNFLIDWVKDHVLEEDRKIGEFYQKEISHGNHCGLAEQHKKIIGKFDRLKELFHKKLINIEDFREKKIGILVDLLKEIGLNCIRPFFCEMDRLIAEDLVSEKDKQLVVENFFKDTSLKDSLTKIKEIEGKLFLLRLFEDHGLAAEEEILEKKNQILNEL